MVLQDEDRSFITQRLVLVVAGTALVVGSLLAGLIYFLVSRPGPPSGDTPVVLVGDSMIYKAADRNDKNYHWQSVTPNKVYSAALTYQIETIALKQKTGNDNDDPLPDDGDTTTDLFGVDVSSASTWKIDEYANDSDTDPVITIALGPGGSSITLSVNDSPKPGYLCPVVKDKLRRLQYGQQLGQNNDCTDAGSFKFYKAILTVTANGQAQSPQILPCTNRKGSKGKCRLVFRGPVS